MERDGGSEGKNGDSQVLSRHETFNGLFGSEKCWCIMIPLCIKEGERWKKKELGRCWVVYLFDAYFFLDFPFFLGSLSISAIFHETRISGNYSNDYCVSSGIFISHFYTARRIIIEIIKRIILPPPRKCLINIHAEAGVIVFLC